MEALTVCLAIETDHRARRDLDVLVDDGAPDLRVPPHLDVLEEHALFDLAERVHAAPDAEHASVNAAPRNDAAMAYHRVGRDPYPSLGLVAEHELGRRVVRRTSPNRPPEVIEVELGMDLDEIHLRFPVGIDGSDVSPVSPVGTFFLAGDEIRGEIVSEDRRALRHQTRQDVATEIVSAIRERLVCFELAHQHLALEHVVAHRGQAPGRVARHRGRVVDFLVKLENPPGRVDLENSELTGSLSWNRNRCDGGVRTHLFVARNHLPHIHLVDVVTAEDAYESGPLVADDVLALPDGIGRAAVPGFPGSLLSGYGLDVLVEDGRQAPVSRDVLFERSALVLRQDFDLAKTRVYEVRKNDVDDAIAARKRNGGLGPIERERVEALSFAARKHHDEDLARVERKNLGFRDHLLSALRDLACGVTGSKPQGPQNLTVMAAHETLSPMPTGPARRAAAAAGWVLWSAASAAYGAEPHPAPAEASSRGPSASPGPKSTSKPARAGDANARRTIAGGPTGDDVLPGAESADLRALREAELELFPAPSSSTRASHWPSEGQLPSSGEGPNVVATGLPPGPARLGAEANRIDVSWLEPLEMPDLPVRWDERVVRYLKFFRDDPYGRTTFANLYRHSGRWREMIRRALRRRSLPDDLAWVCMIESGFDATAHSSAGAIGLWQLMPETAKIYGLTIDHWVDQRLSPTLATQAAVTFLDDLHRRFGSWELALAGFNMGHAGLASVVRRYNTNDFWSLAHTEGTLPWETTLYVPKILAAAVISHNLAAFGFGDLLVEGAVETDDVEVAPATSLAAIAQASSCSLHEIEALNPELRASRTPPADGGDAATYTVHVPQGKGAAAAQALSRLRKDQPALERYTVRFGETLDQVATARRTTSQKLVELNAIVPGEVLRGGTVLLVPALTGGESAPAPSSPKTSVVVPPDLFVYPDRERVFYRVIALDTLKDIAAALHVSQDDLRRWNDLDAAARLQEGMTLQAFVAPDADLSGVVVLREKDVRVLPVGSDEFFAVLEQEKGFRRTTVTAKAGETVESIGKHFSVPPRTMERINRRSRNDTLKPGEAVVVYVPCKAPCAARAGTASSEPVVVGARSPQPTD